MITAQNENKYKCTWLIDRLIATVIHITVSYLHVQHNGSNAIGFVQMSMEYVEENTNSQGYFVITTNKPCNHRLRKNYSSTALSIREAQRVDLQLNESTSSSVS